ncbi:MAG: ABC transporter ATP-binding protein, partial [Christensenellaceae bacterium]|nr:ABC transporter ATP-binding protein [Christensenellaceae bacterium]
ILLQVIIKAPIMGIWAISKIFGKSWEWTIATGIALVSVLTLFIVIISLTVPKFTIMQKLIDRVSRIARENITGIRVIRAYQAQEYHEQKFKNANEQLTEVNKFTGRTMGFMDPMMIFIMSILNLAIYWIGGYLISAADMSDKLPLFSDMVVFSSYARQVIMAFMMMTITFIIFPRAKVSANRINEVLTTPISIVEGETEQSDEDKIGTLEFKNVCFKYPDAEEYVVKNINFSAKKGDTIALIGSTGSGKSTIINLIPRLFDATEGEILLEGINVKEYTFEALYNKIAYIPQQPILFSGTVFSNVAFGKNKNEKITEDDVKKALTIAQAIDFVEELDGGIHAEIARGGTNVSGGQRQRLSIARAICREANFLIFDDSFSALDFKTDFNLRNALKNETEGITKIIVAQRIGTIMDADQILVIDDGEIVGKGTHKELLKKCPVYMEIAESQLSKEEIYGAQR